MAAQYVAIRRELIEARKKVKELSSELTGPPSVRVARLFNTLNSRQRYQVIFVRTLPSPLPSPSLHSSFGTDSFAISWKHLLWYQQLAWLCDSTLASSESSRPTPISFFTSLSLHPFHHNPLYITLPPHLFLHLPPCDSLI